MHKSILISLVMATSASILAPQDRGRFEIEGSGIRPNAVRPTAAGEVKSAVITPQGVVKVASLQVNGLVPVIVQMQDEPLLARKRNLAKVGLQERNRQAVLHYERLKQSHALMRAWIRTQEPGKADQDFKEYHFAFNGLATSVTQETLQKLKQRPDVLRVFRDEQVKATLAESVPLIGAPQMWDAYGLDGEGIRVAVLDTGIDYNHPDLGGGFGPGFKVIGGYDFINGDADPMDDQGHGTHVAGIIAANGTVKGVAPKASLLAYKVLGANGSGSMSTVMAGIERAVDPDQDPATDDGAQVINMSLGASGGDPDDAVSQAVDVAVSAGVVCVVAAGNDGSNYSTIGSPGCARKALTVGASDKQDVIASFSSRGPSQPDLAIKPDVTAPGVSISSTLLGGGYITHSGTSMATPHVAGAVALLLQGHPTWTPEIVKAVLSEKAKDLAQDSFTQGSGRIQVVPSHLAKAAMVPNNLNFGIVDVSKGTWSKTLGVSLVNLDPSTRTYSLVMQGQGQPGATWTISPASVVLGPGQTQAVAVTLMVDNALLPYAPSPNLVYEAKLAATSADDELRAPVVFYKACSLTINFDQLPESLIIFDQNNDATDGFSYKVFGGFAAGLQNTLTVLLPPRTYDVMLRYWDFPWDNSRHNQYYIVKENINLNVQGHATVDVNFQQEAFHAVTLNSFDSRGSAIKPSELIEPGADCTLTHQSGMKYVLRGPVSDFYFSTLSNAYTFDLLQFGWSDSSTGGKYYEFRHSFTGISSDLTLASAPSKSLKLAFNVDPAIDSIWVGFMRYMMYVGGDRYWGNFAYGSIQPGDQPPWVLKRPFNLEVDLSSHPRPGFLSSQSSPWVMAYRGGSVPEEQLFEGGLLSAVDGDTMGIYDHGEPSIPFHVTRGSQVVMGEAPSYWTGQLTVSPGLATLSSTRGWAPLFYGQSAETVPGALSYQLFQGSSPIGGSSVSSFMRPGSYTPTFGIPTGACSLQIPFDGYFVHGQRGHALATLTFDSGRADKSPPYLKRFSIQKDGEVASTTAAGSLNQLEVQVGDDGSLATLQAYYQTDGDWQPLALPLPSGPSAGFLVALPSELPQGFVNLKFIAADGDGNSLTQELRPAFYHSALPAPGSPAGPAVSPVGTTSAYASILQGNWGSVNHTFDWGDGTNSTTDPTPSGTPASASHAWSSPGVFSVRVRVSDSLGHASEWSEPLVVTVPGPPTITTQPRSGTTNTTGSGWIPLFTVEAKGAAPLSYQWRKNGADIAGATDNSYTLTTFTMADDGARFSVVVSNPFGSVASSDAILTVLGPPTITVPPANVSAHLGEPAAFLVEASGTGPLTYQWRRNGVAIGGTTTNAYTTPPVTVADQGAAYSVVVGNPLGSVVSNDAILTVLLTPTPATSVTMTASLPSPQVVGTAVNFTATGHGSNTTNYLYRFYLNGAVVQNGYGNTWRLPANTPAGTYAVGLVVSADPAVWWQTETTLTYTINPPTPTPATSVTMVASLPSPQVVGTAVNFTATGHGSNTTNYLYRFYLNGAVVQNGYGNTWTLPANTPAGTYAVGLVVSADPAVWWQTETTLTYTINPPTPTPATSVTMTASLPSPQVVGTAVNFTATGHGSNTTNYLYRFYLNGAVVQNGYGNTWTLPANTPAGTYAVGLVVSADPAVWWQTETILPFTINPPTPTPATSVTMTASLPSPQVVGTAVTFTATGHGSNTTNYLYRFYLNGAVVQNGYGNTWTLPANTPAGTYAVGLVVSADPAVWWQTETTLTYTINPPTPTPATSVTMTASLPSPQVVGTAVTFTATGHGSNTTNYLYRFYLNGAVVQNGYGNTWTLPANTPAGTYAVGLVVSADPAVWWQTETILPFTINPPTPTPATSVTMTASLPSPQVVGTAVTFTATGHGSNTTNYLYRFYLNGAVVQNGYGNTWTLPANTPAGTYAVGLVVSADPAVWWQTETILPFTIE